MRARSVLAALTALATVTPAAAQPLPDPYGEEDPPPPPEEAAPPDGAVSDRDPEVEEAIAAALVARARELIGLEEYVDAQQLLGEALVRSPDGPAGADARVLLEQVNAMLGITTTPPEPPPEIVPPIDPAQTITPVDPAIGAELDRPEPTPSGRTFMLHAAVIGGFVGGFFGDAASADTEPFEVDGDDVNTETSGPVIGGVLLGGLAGLAVGAGFRRSRWMTRDDIVVIDSFAAMGMVGALSMGALMDPAEGEAYSVNAILGIGAGVITGFVVARKRDISARRMGRVDLWAASGAVAPWLIFAAAGGGTSDDAQAVGFFSMAGMAAGAWLGFRLTRKWDRDRVAAGPAPRDDAPLALLRRDAAGMWSLGTPGLRPASNPVLGPALGAGMAADVLGVSF
jgi:hypothetical protein